MKRLYFLAAILLIPTFLFARKPKVISGKVSALKNVEDVNVKFDFSKWTFYNEKKSEKEYLAKRRKDIVKDKGEGEFKKWKADWEDMKSSRIPNVFISNLNDYIRGDMDFDMNETDASYTAIVRPLWVYPGYFSGIMNQPSKTTLTISFYKSDDLKNPILVLQVNKLKGRHFLIPNTNKRIANAFATAGSVIGHYLHKKL